MAGYATVRIPELKIVAIELDDEAGLRAWYDANAAGLAAGRVDATNATFQETLVAYQRPSAHQRNEVFAALDGDGVVGTGNLALPLRENQRLALFHVVVEPEHRGAGVGSALYEYVEERARTEGRTSLLTDIYLPEGVEPADWPGISFATRRGFSLRNTELRRQSRLPADDARLAALATKAAERASAYRLESWTGACPEPYAEQYARFRGLLSVEAPSGGVEYEPEIWDVERLREDEARTFGRGRTLHVTVAVAPDGSLAGHTALRVSQHDPSRAYQADTLVLPDHRGHRLGLALKVTNLRILQERHPEVARIETWNAVQNGPMVAINEELGFRIVESVQDWQRDL
ncbi:GNAT family N-acetyltransferase [Actinopolymorpha pittospori]